MTQPTDRSHSGPLPPAPPSATSERARSFPPGAVDLSDSEFDPTVQVHGVARPGVVCDAVDMWRRPTLAESAFAADPRKEILGALRRAAEDSKICCGRRRRIASVSKTTTWRPWPGTPAGGCASGESRCTGHATVSSSITAGGARLPVRQSRTAATRSSSPRTRRCGSMRSPRRHFAGSGRRRRGAAPREPVRCRDAGAADRRRYDGSADDEGGPDRAAELAALISPFVLRRRKSDPGIAPELLPKTEIDLDVKLTPEQAGLYETLVREAMERIETCEGIGRRASIVSLLTGLEQICNHPPSTSARNTPRSPVVPTRSVCSTSCSTPTCPRAGVRS